MEPHTQPKFGKHIPSYLQAELTKAHQSKQGIAEPTDDLPSNNEAIEPTTENQPTDTPPETVSTPTEPPSQQAETVPHSESSSQESDDNDIKAWKGRLKKEQTERQNLNARLIEEAEARERAEQRIRELEQRMQHQQAEQSTQASSSAPNGLSESELHELKMFNPDLYLKVKNAQSSSKTPVTPAQPSTEPPPANTQAQTQPTQTSLSERDRIWYAEVQREIPEIQGLLGDPKFVEFAQEKTDWTGASGLDLIQQAGAKKDVRLILPLRNLLDEYKQSQVPTQAPVTVAPQTSATVKAKVSTPKEMTKKDEAHAEMLARQGKTAELRAFLAKFKQ